MLPNSHSSPCRPKPPGLEPLLLRGFFWIQLSRLWASLPEGGIGGEDGDDADDSGDDGEPAMLAVVSVGMAPSDWWRLWRCAGAGACEGLGCVWVWFNGVVEEAEEAEMVLARVLLRDKVEISDGGGGGGLWDLGLDLEEKKGNEWCGSRVFVGDLEDCGLRDDRVVLGESVGGLELMLCPYSGSGADPAAGADDIG